MFKVGDKIVCSEWGLGVVVYLDNNKKYPVKCEFIHKDIYDTYTEDGMMYSDNHLGIIHSSRIIHSIRHLTPLEKLL